MALIVASKLGPHGSILVITDKDLLGKKFEEDNRQLDMTSSFFQGEQMQKEQIVTKIANTRNLHLTGKEAVALGVELDLVHPNKILYVENVPHAQVVVEN